MAKNQAVSGSLVAWKIVPAVSEVWWRQTRHWTLGRVLSRVPALGAAAQGADEPGGPAQLLHRRPAPLLGAVGLPELHLAQALDP